MKKLPHSVKLNFLLLIGCLLTTSCKTPPPDVTPCLIQGQDTAGILFADGTRSPSLVERSKVCNSEMRALGDPKCSIDVRSEWAHCSPVIPSSTKKAHDMAIYEMDKATAFSNFDYGTIGQWIVQHEQ